jgi:hypothetical protein
MKFPIACLAYNQDEVNQFLEKTQAYDLHSGVMLVNTIELTRGQKFSGMILLPGAFNLVGFKDILEATLYFIDYTPKHEVGQWVSASQDYSGVPKFTRGIIVEDYGTGLTVAWDRPDTPIPRYLTCTEISELPASHYNAPLRDGFDKETEVSSLILLRGKRHPI